MASSVRWVFAILITFALGCGAAPGMNPVVASAREASNATALVIENTRSVALVLYRADQERVLARAKAEN